MGRWAKDNGSDFEYPPVGTHVARCFKIIDIGTQHGEINGQAKTRNQILVYWELPNEKMQDGSIFIVSKFYTNSVNEKSNLCKDLEAWRGGIKFTDKEREGFDLSAILGKPCMLSVTAKKSGDGTQVGAVMAVPKGMTVPVQVNPSFTFWIDEWDQQKFDSLSDKMKMLIAKSDEYINRPVGTKNNEVPAGSGVPF